jgi:hypothetical protein
MMVATAAAAYVIRYRFDGDHRALLVQDSVGDAYIVGPSGLVCRFSGAYDFPTLEPTLRGLGWIPVPRVDPYRLEELQRLLAPAA